MSFKWLLALMISSFVLMASKCGGSDASNSSSVEVETMPGDQWSDDMGNDPLSDEMTLPDDEEMIIPEEDAMDDDSF